MQTSTLSAIVALCLLLNLSSCLNHDSPESLAPVRLRLKNVQGNSVNTTYTYDNQNRLATITKADGSFGVFAYGDPDKKFVNTDAEKDFTYFILYSNPADRTTGEITRLPQTLNGTNFQADTYPLVNSKLFLSWKSRYTTYSFDANKHVTSIFRYSTAPTGDSYSYTYTGENITKNITRLSGGHFVSSYTFDYDDKINPFYGLLDPGLADIQAFSRSNVVTTAYTSEPSIPNPVTAYKYEYNAQGLPIKRTVKQGVNVGEVLTYTYESY
ncbi:MULTISPECIES: hypothetical protein [unclassified Spirosoma]|uniref:hypothetical protein n=1 Tax=unclassified Spirosoma TaxID=2621999 RepID=UPI000AE15147|nr:MULTISPECIES: hypothetical protein [unclassified Spirosoma]MBN8824014.1 hypothetical protein [Spirosoma sp.]